MINRTLAELDREWAEMQAAPTSVQALARWSDVEPALAGCVTLGDILRTRKAKPSAAPAILAALSRLSLADELAARTLLQALVPGLLGLVTGPLAGEPGALDEVISLAWERIRTYPTQRPGSVAANVLWDVRKRYRKHREIETPLNQPGGGGSGPATPSAEDVAMQRWGLDDVVDACRNGVIGKVALDLILRTRLEGASLEEAAAAHNASAAWANCVRWRAERRLRPVLARAS